MDFKGKQILGDRSDKTLAQQETFQSTYEQKRLQDSLNNKIFPFSLLIKKTRRGPKVCESVSKL